MHFHYVWLMLFCECSLATAGTKLGLHKVPVLRDRLQAMQALSEVLAFFAWGEFDMMRFTGSNAKQDAAVVHGSWGL